METLKHNGIMLPVYNPIGLAIEVKGKQLKLDPLQEEMAVAFVKKEHLDSFKDPVFIRNFLIDFSRVIQNGDLDISDVNFSAVRNYVNKLKKQKESLTPEKKKELREAKKKQSEANKKKFGFAMVDGEEVALANYKAEPAGIFMGRGDHPLRGRWKDAVRIKDITLNLSPDAKTPKGFEKAKREWNSKGFWIAKWDNNRKYVWISDNEPMKQQKDIEKFDFANVLAKKINSVKIYIMMGMASDKKKVRKVATCCYLIQRLGIRVGDEKDEDEADTVGATTLRPEHVTIVNGNVTFDFLGKDCVRYKKTITVHKNAKDNLKQYILQAKFSKGQIFDGVSSMDVNNFLKGAMKGLTGKVFRTFLATKIVKEFLMVDEEEIAEMSEPDKLLTAKLANVEAAKVMNHQRKVPESFDGTTAKKEAKLIELAKKVNTLKINASKESTGNKKAKLLARADKVKLQISKIASDIVTRQHTRELNVNTSLRSYIDPRAYAEYARKTGVDITKIYPKSLQRKFSWALGDLINSKIKEKEKKAEAEKVAIKSKKKIVPKVKIPIKQKKTITKKPQKQIEKPPITTFTCEKKPKKKSKASKKP
jgi:DNA topoisomerase-1